MLSKATDAPEENFGPACQELVEFQGIATPSVTQALPCGQATSTSQYSLVHGLTVRLERANRGLVWFCELLVWIGLVWLCELFVRLYNRLPRNV